MFLLKLLLILNNLLLFDASASILPPDVVDYGKLGNRTDFKTMDLYLHCKLQPEGFNCNKLTGPEKSRFYYDTRLGMCKTFEYHGCNVSYNMFRVLKDCYSACNGIEADVSEDLIAELACRLQPDFGDCNGYFPMWYFDVSARLCKGFAYSGCGGNANRFATRQDCGICMTAIPSPIKENQDYT